MAQFVELFANGVITTLSPYVTSKFGGHSLVSTAQVIAAIVAGLVQLPYAKLLDVWGRPQGLTIMVVCQTLGFILLAVCKDVKTYCAGRVFVQTGYSAIILTIIILIADTSTLRHRALWIGLLSTPTLITTWTFGLYTTTVAQTLGFRWGMGIFAILGPVTSGPLCAFLYYYQRKSRKAYPEEIQKNGRILRQSIVHFAKEFDVIGLLILTVGLGLFLLSFNLVSYQADGWHSPMIICFIVIGGLLIITFVLYEKYLAPFTFIPWDLLQERTVIGAYAMNIFLIAAFYTWGTYFLSMLILVWRQTITHASYIFNVQAVGATLSGILVGGAIILGMRLKYLALFGAFPLILLGAGLLYHFSLSNNIGYLVMTQVFLALGTGILIVCEEVTLMAVSPQQRIPALIATETLMASIGTAIGSAVSGAIWSSTFPQKLTEALPDHDVKLAHEIYSSIYVQLSFAPGTPVGDAIVHAYGTSLQVMLITSMCLYVGAGLSVACWRNVDLGKRGFMKGRL